MKKRRSKIQSPHVSYLIWTLLVATCSLLILMLIPFVTALSAGIASLSIVVFGSLLLLAIIILLLLPRHEPLLGITLLLALVGILLPQALFVRTASHTGATLQLNPASYVHFSGRTTIEPTETRVYKSTPQAPLELAYYAAKRGLEIAIYPAPPRPTVVLLHGGGWQYGSHLETGVWPKLLSGAGYNVFSVEYRLAGPQYATWRDAPADVHDALLYIREHAADFRVDPNDIALMGQSAGGHLALFEAYQNSSVRSVIALYAPVDLALDYETSRDKSSELAFLGGTPQQQPERYRQLSPLTYVSDRSPRTLFVQGLTDDLVAPQNASRLMQALAEHDIEHRALYLPLTGHSFENQRGGFATQITEHSVLDFLR